MVRDIDWESRDTDLEVNSKKMGLEGMKAHEQVEKRRSRSEPWTVLVLE